MSYTPINWQTGQTITAEKLNKMDNGWGVQQTQLFSETVTTVYDENEGACVGLTNYNTPISQDTITVTLNNVNYTCNRIDAFGMYFYGGFNEGPDFSNYPFFIISSSDGESPCILYTETAGTYTLAVSAATLAISDIFSAAVNSAVSSDRFQINRGTTTWQEVYDALNAGKFVYYLENNDANTVNLNVVIYAGLNTRLDHIIRAVSYDGTSIINTGMSTTSADGVLN